VLRPRRGSWAYRARACLDFMLLLVAISGAKTDSRQKQQSL
jgi:hypothetical protein